ncbi:MAG TPA: RNA methyltransferase [Trebonia sp.]|jgi:TrmH family RNA methyltransferase|nr:RNA methyltransferase [Trebonia sp.]
MGEMITSAANPLVKRVRSLADRRHRRQQGAFVVEGAQPVGRAFEAGWEVEVLIVAPGLLTGAAAAIAAAAQQRGVRVARLSAELFGRVSDREGPSGLAAIVRGRLTPPGGLPARPGAVYVALHEIGNPGNLGTIIRTADAAGAAGVILIGDTADPFAPGAVKASMGSLFAVPVAHMADAGTFFGWARAAGVRVVATSGRADSEHWATRYRPPLAILLGSEGRGLPPEALAQADERVRIPMTGTPESLNLAVAAGIMLYEVRRQATGAGVAGVGG